MTSFHQIATTSGNVWIRVDHHSAGRNVVAYDWTDGTSQADIDAAVATVAGW